jgi:hypothetical protein
MTADADIGFEFFQPEDVTGDAAEKPFDEADPTFAAQKPRPAAARQYEKKIAAILRTGFKAAAEHPSTVPDAAAILMYGPDFARTGGDLANADPRVRKAIDWLTEGTENPYLAFAFAALPFAAQIYRNHEDTANPKAVATAVKESRKRMKERAPREWRIPFTNRTIRIKLAFSLPSLKAITSPPEALTEHVFTNPAILRTLEKEEIKLAWQANTANGSKRTR